MGWKDERDEAVGGEGEVSGLLGDEMGRGKNEMEVESMYENV